MLVQGLIDQFLMDQDLIGQYFFFQFLEIQLLFVPYYPGMAKPGAENPHPGFPGVDGSGVENPGSVPMNQALAVLLSLLLSQGIPGFCIPCR